MDFYFPHPHETLCYETEDDHTDERVLKHSVYVVTFTKVPNMFEIKPQERKKKGQNFGKIYSSISLSIRSLFRCQDI